MVQRARPTASAADFLPRTPHPSLPQLRDAAACCKGCDLYKNATQTVFGEGPRAAPLMLLGEMPGDKEDLEGRPFVGPAGRLLDQGLEDAGIDRSLVYVTNVVKHFKWTPRGSRRLHTKPSIGEIRACRPWLEQELAIVQPTILVCLGATAAQALQGASFRITRQRGKLLDGPVLNAGCGGAAGLFGDGGDPAASHPRLLATLHPAAILRMPDEASRRGAYDDLVADLRVVAGVIRR